MNELRDLARDGPVADFADRPPAAFGYGRASVTSGLSLQVDGYWLSWWGMQDPGFGPWPQPHEQRTGRVHFNRRYDFSRRPEDWDEHCKRKGLHKAAHPVAVVVILRNQPVHGLPESWPRFVGDHPVIYEYRPAAVLQAVQPGDSVSGATMGTLGGYLWRASDGRNFALSCAHVFGNGPASRVDAGSVHVGSVVESHMPPINTGVCNNRIQTPISVHTVDVAVADLAGNPPIQLAHKGAGKIATRTPIAHIGQGDLVTLNGATSGTLAGKVKECNIWKEFSFHGNTYCFGDLLVVEDVNFHYLASQFTKAGDSGAWVVSTRAGHASWDAMLIAGDGANAYCCYSENIMAMIDPGLSIPP